MKMELSNKILSDITVYMKYAKFVPEWNRRETWEELVKRNKNMHIKKYPKLKNEIEDEESIDRTNYSKGDNRDFNDGDRNSVRDFKLDGEFSNMYNSPRDIFW